MKIPGLTNRHRILLYAVTALLCVASVAMLYEIRSDQFGPIAKAYLESLLARRIEIGEASFTVWGRVTLHDVRVHNPPGSSTPYLAEIPRVRFYLGMTGGETSAFRPTGITFENPRFSFERIDTGPWNTDRLFVARPPRHDHPTFTLPITIRGASVAYRDSQVGRHGIHLDFQDVDAVFTVMSDGNEITNFLQTDPIRLGEGGDVTLTIQSHPNNRSTDASIQLRGADVRLLAPYYEFLSFLEFRSGRGTGHYKIAFRGDTWAGNAEIAIREAEIHHAASATTFRDANPRIEFSVEGSRERIDLRSLTVRWLQSTIRGEGFFAPRSATRPTADVKLATQNAKAEDLAFLLCDPLFRPTGSLSGTCRLVTSPGADSRYDIRVDLASASIRYGEILRKPAGTRARLEIDGRFGERPEKIGITVAQSTGMLVADGGTWLLQLDRARGADLKTYLVALADRPELALDGPVTARLRLGSAGRISGQVDLTEASIGIGSAATKLAGRSARFLLEAQLRPDGWRVTDGDIQVLGSRFHVAGSWTPDQTQWTAHVVRLAYDDLVEILGKSGNREVSAVTWSGPLAGRIEWRSRARDGGEISASADLTPVHLRVDGAGSKPSGVPGELRVSGQVSGGVLVISDGRLRMQGTTLSTAGEIGGGGASLSLRGNGTGLDGLKNFLAGSFWGGLAQLEATGSGDVEISVQGRAGMTTIRADLVATWARLAYADTWMKPAGQSFRAHALIVRMPEVTRVERLEIVQGSSSLSAAGTISSGRPAALDASVTAQIDVPRFVRDAPGLQRITVERRNAAEALHLIADAENRATLNWRATGTLEEPRLDLAMKEIVGRAVVNTIARQIRRFASIITAPVTFGFDVIRGRARTDTADDFAEPPTPLP